MEDAPKVLGHAFILKWVVGATMVKLAQANKTTRHTYIMMVYVSQYSCCMQVGHKKHGHCSHALEEDAPNI